VDAATSSLITQGGVFGAFFVFVTVPLAFYAKSLSQRLGEVQAARVQDAREVRDTLLAVTTEFNGALREQVRTSTEVKNVYERTLQTLDRVEKRIEILEDTVRESHAHKGARR
jgi:hypothetical protein